jgi:cytochrome P450
MLTISQIPPGIIASTAAYDQGRLASVYPEPESWQPSRWLDATDEMHLNWTPFGHGARACPGSNLAMTELKYMIGTIFRLHRVEPPKQESRSWRYLCVGREIWELLVAFFKN